MSEAHAFEQALLANPDDGTGWHAYADYLAEQDDPRGEFMQVQLALETGGLRKEDRKRFQERERELLQEHEREWLGDLAPVLLDLTSHDTLPDVRHWWGRGFLAEMRVRHLTVPLTQAIANAPAARFLRKLHIESSASHPLGGYSPQALFEATSQPCFANLRVLQVGNEPENSLDGVIESNLEIPGLEHLVACLWRVEELYLMCNGYDANTLFQLPNLAHLQTLRIYGLGEVFDPDYEVPLNLLARNAALGSLTHLFIHPAGMGYLPASQVHTLVNSPHLKSLEHLQLRMSNMGDEGVRAIIESGILKRLGWLDLRNGTITDYGAKALADYPPTKNLRRLDLSRNHLTPPGVKLLERAGVNVVVETRLSRRESEIRDRNEREQERLERLRRDDDWE